MKIEHYKKGDVIKDVLQMTAGQDMTICSDGNIRCDCFDEGEFIQIPNIVADKKGSGGLDHLLFEIEQYFGKPLKFATLINRRLEEHLKKKGYEILAGEGKIMGEEEEYHGEGEQEAEHEAKEAEQIQADWEAQKEWENSQGLEGA